MLDRFEKNTGGTDDDLFTSTSTAGPRCVQWTRVSVCRKGGLRVAVGSVGSNSLATVVLEGNSVAWQQFLATGAGV